MEMIDTNEHKSLRRRMNFLLVSAIIMWAIALGAMGWAIYSIVSTLIEVNVL
jgi:hypothetical protein